MRAIVIKGFGGLDSLVIEKLRNLESRPCRHRGKGLWH